MKKIVYLFLLIGGIAFGQEQVTKKLGDFHTLKVFNGLKVELERSSDPKIEIYGSHANAISIKNSDGILKIRVDIFEGFKADDVRVVVKYKNDIQTIDANEGSFVSAEKPIKQDHFEIKVQEGARVHLTVNTDHLYVKAVSGGFVKVEGKTDSQRLEVTTGAVYEGFELESDSTEALSATGARVEVNAGDRLDAKVRLRGMIYYKGTPDTLITKKTVGGTIQQVD